MSGIFVTSSNRGAVRRVLVASGAPATEVRTWSLATLGEKLREAVSAGRVTEADAIAACSMAGAPASADVEPVDTPAAAPVAPVNGGKADKAAANLASAIAAAVAAAMGSVPTGTDEAKVRAIVSEMIDAARMTPAVVEIRTGDAVRKIEGRTHAMFETILKIVSTRVAGRRLHVWMAGPSGSGKSHLAKQCADALGLAFYSTGAIQSKYDLVGFVAPSGDEATLMTPFRMAFEHGGVFSWDDCDASDPRAFVAFNEALSNGRFAFPDRVVEQHPDFVAVASANTWGNGATADYVGRNKIDGATLSRFVRVNVDYDEELERDLVGVEGRMWADYVQRVRRAVKTVGVKVLVTPRQTLQGAALLAAGIPRDEVERMTIFAGMDRETESKLRAAA